MIDQILLQPNENTGKIDIFLKGKKIGEANDWTKAGELADKLRFEDEIIPSER